MSELPIEIVASIVTIVGGIAAAVAVWIRSKSKESVIRAESERDAAKAEIEHTKSQAQADMMRVQSQSMQTATIMTLFEKQLALNEQNSKQLSEYLKALQEKERRDEANYKVLEASQRDVGIMLLQELKTHGTRIVDRVDKAEANIITEVKAVPAFVDMMTEEKLKAFASTLATVMYDAMQKAEQKRMLPPTTPPFPTSDDARWEEARIIPANGHDVQVKTSPHMGEAQTKIVWQLDNAGEKVRVIHEPLFHAYAVFGESKQGKPRYGWVPISAVKVEKNGAGD